MRNVKLLGISGVKPDHCIEFNGHRRWRCLPNTNQLDLAVQAALLTLEKASLKITDIDCIVSASAVCMQPLPCNAALIHEKIARGTSIPCIDINTTCTSFISALDIISYLIDAGRYKNVLIIASDVPSFGLNSNQKESYELFSDGASAVIITKSDGASKMIYSKQATWSEGAHDTEIRGGGSFKPPHLFDPSELNDYLFDMNGRAILRLVHNKVFGFMNEFFEEGNFSKEDIDMVVPHQASLALDFMMRKLDIKKGQYIDILKDVGNMVAASVPYTLCYGVENNLIKRGDKLLLLGTAAGLTINALYLVY